MQVRPFFFYNIPKPLTYNTPFYG